MTPPPRVKYWLIVFYVLLCFYLQLIATGTNTNENVYFVTNFDALDGIVIQLSEIIETIALEGIVLCC